MYPAQFDQNQSMLRYQTMNELWHGFIEKHLEMATGMQNKKQPNAAPMLFRKNAPWEMRKAQDSGFLCKAREIFHLLLRGVIGACAAIDKLIDRLRSLGALSEETCSQFDVLAQIKDVIATPRKYDTIVKCLKPCLNTNKLESAVHTCLDGKACNACGFRQWWSKSLKKNFSMLTQK